jgi:4,5-DOPA dioxygenase extradiol
MKLNELHKTSSSFKNSEKMPVLFVGHGSPMNAIEDNEFVTGWRNISNTLPVPSAILCISAHWETKGTLVTAMEKPKTIHDFGGFPQALYDVQYPAAGSPEFATETKNIIKKATLELNYKWGLDHGCWSVVKHLYPAADVPVFQLSLDHYESAQYHFDLARELSPLRKRGVLIIGSGNMVHNLGMVAWDKFDVPGFAYDWAVEAGDLMKMYISNGDIQQLINYKSQGKAYSLAIPTPEHYLPMLYAIALKEENENLVLFNDKAVAGSLMMTSFKIDKE